MGVQGLKCSQLGRREALPGELPGVFSREIKPQWTRRLSPSHFDTRRMDSVAHCRSRLFTNGSLRQSITSMIFIGSDLLGSQAFYFMNVWVIWIQMTRMIYSPGRRMGKARNTHHKCLLIKNKFITAQSSRLIRFEWQTVLPRVSQYLKALLQTNGAPKVLPNTDLQACDFETEHHYKSLRMGKSPAVHIGCRQ